MYVVGVLRLSIALDGKDKSRCSHRWSGFCNRLCSFFIIFLEHPPLRSSGNTILNSERCTCDKCAKDIAQRHSAIRLCLCVRAPIVCSPVTKRLHVFFFRLPGDKQYRVEIFGTQGLFQATLTTESYTLNMKGSIRTKQSNSTPRLI